MKKRRARHYHWIRLCLVVLVAFALSCAFVWHLWPQAPGQVLSGATGLLTVRVCQMTDEGLDCGAEPPPPPPQDTGGGGSIQGPTVSHGGGGPGEHAIVPQKPVGNVQPDLDSDGKVTLADFSIMAYWFNKPLSGNGARADLNGDGKVTLVDFSILAYYWKKQ